MKVAVTGATGFTGRRVAAELVRRGHAVVALVRPPIERPGLFPSSIRIVEGDLAAGRGLRELLGGAEALLHVASLGFGQAEPVLDAVDQTGVPRGVFFSSTSLYTKLPAASKAERIGAEERVRRSRCAFTLLRPTMIYGDAGDRNLSRLVRFVARSPVIPLPGGGRGLLQPVHVDDLARAAADVLECPATLGREYELPGAEASPLREIVDFLRRRLGRRAPVVPLPLGPAAAFAGLWSALRLPPRITVEQVRRLAEDKAFPYDRAREDFGYAPRGWREGLEQELAVLREQGFIR